jgi:hypothetical protein
VEDFAAVPVCVFVVPAVGVEPEFCVLLAEAAAGFAAGFAGFGAGVELSAAAGALAGGGVVDGFVAGVCCAAAEPAKKMVAANTPTGMLGSFRMDLVSHCFAAGANGVVGDC